MIIEDPLNHDIHHSLSSWIMKVPNTQLTYEYSQLVSCEDIRNLCICEKFSRLNFLRLNSFSYKIAVHLYMLCVFIKNCIVGYESCCLIVTI